MSPQAACHLPFRPVVIIGAGIAGLDMACGLKRKLKFDDFIVFDRNAALGGTWHDNDYPGCAVDIPGFLYQLSYAPEPNFSRCFPSHAEMNNYLHRVADRFDIPKHIRFNMTWTGASWDDKRKLWTVVLRSTKTGETFIQECKVLIGAIGHQVDPKDFQVPGKDAFRGTIFHAAKYPKGMDLKGKNVVVLGTGSTATQVIPNILNDVKSCTQIQREPHWILNRPNPPVPQMLRTMLAYLPCLFVLLQNMTFMLVELFFPIMGRTISKRARRNLKEANVPEKYWSTLTPSYTPGCKRIVFSVDYLQCLKNPKVNLVQDTIASLTETHVVTSSGASFEADVVILCHGFKADTFYYPITGRGGVTPAEHWDVAGGPSCYKGCAMNGFPNFFSIRGPNVSSGFVLANEPSPSQTPWALSSALQPWHQSLIWFIEATTALILNVAGELIKGDLDVVEVASQAEQSYVRRIQAACQRGFWGRDCHTFYVTEKGWNHTVYPWTPYWLYFHRFVNRAHWTVTPRSIKED